MARPDTTATTERLWGALPQLYRDADEAQGDGVDGWPLLRYVSLLGDQADELAALYGRLALHDDGAGDWRSDLGDPEAADDVWLPWLASLAGLSLYVGSGVGESFHQLVLDYATFDLMRADNATFDFVRLHAQFVPGALGPEALRLALLGVGGARFAGSTQAWEMLLEPYLVGYKWVLHDRIFGGDAWHLRLHTYAAETPDPTRLGLVIAAAARAAGLLVDYEVRAGSSFDQIVAGWATFAAITAGLPTFDALTAWVPPP